METFTSWCPIVFGGIICKMVSMYLPTVMNIKVFIVGVFLDHLVVNVTLAYDMSYVMIKSAFLHMQKQKGTVQLISAVAFTTLYR